MAIHIESHIQMKRKEIQNPFPPEETKQN